MKVFSSRHVALFMALTMSFSSAGNLGNLFDKGLKTGSYSYVVSDESIDMATESDATYDDNQQDYYDTNVSWDAASEGDADDTDDTETTLEISKDILRGKLPSSTGAEADGKYFLDQIGPETLLRGVTPDEYHDITSYLDHHVIYVDGTEYDHVSKLNPTRAFELYIDFELSRDDLKANGLKYRYALPENITIGNLGSENEQYNLYNQKGQLIGTYFLKDDVIYITFPGYYDSVLAFFSLGANWRNVDNLASTEIAWTNDNETILFDLSQINIAKNISKFVYDNDEATAEFSIVIRPSNDNLSVNDLTFSDKYISSDLKLIEGLYKPASGGKKDICLEIYTADNTRQSQTYYTFSEANLTHTSSTVSEMTITGINIPKGGHAEIKYGIKADAKTLLKMDAKGYKAGYTNTAKGTYDIFDSNGNKLTTAETETKKEGSLNPRTDWIFKTVEEARKKDDDSAVIVPYTIGINRDRLYSLGGSVVQDEITNYDDDGTVIYDFEQTPYVTVYDGENQEDINLTWVKLDQADYDLLKSNLYKASEKTAMENLLNGTSTTMQQIRTKLCSKLGVTKLTNENVSKCIFTSEDVKNFLWFVPLDAKPTYYLLHYYTTASLTDMGSKNAAKMMYTEIEGYPRGPGIGWMNPYKKVLEISKENYGVYEDGNGNYFVDWHIAVTVPKNSHFDHIMLSDDLQNIDLTANASLRTNLVSDSRYAGDYVDWFPAAPDISYNKIYNENKSVEETAEYEWEISDQIFDISSPDYSDPDIKNVVDNLKGVFGDTVYITWDSAKYALTYPDEHATFDTSRYAHVSSYNGRTYVAPGSYLLGSYFEYLYSGRAFDRGQFLGDHFYDGYSYDYDPYHYTWSPSAIKFYIKELPRKDFTYTIDINYTTQINPELMKALPDYCEHQEPMTMTNTIRAFQGVKNNNGEYLYDYKKEIANASASYYISKKDIQANILKKLVGYDDSTKTVSYAVEINPNASISASKTMYELKDIISYSGVKFNPNSLTLMDDSGTEPGVDGKVIWSNGGAAVDSSYQATAAMVNITVNNSDSGSSDITMRFDNNTGLFGAEGEQFKHMYLVYTVDASNWNEADLLSNSVYLYDEKTVPNGTDTYTEFIGSDTCEFVGTDALSKKVVDEPTLDNNFTATFEVVIDTNSAEAGDLMGIAAGEHFTVHDVMSDNLTLDIESIKVEKYDSTNKEWKTHSDVITYPDADNYTLDADITVPDDATKFRIIYDAIVKPYEDMQIIENKVSVKDHSVAEVTFQKKVYTRNNNSGADASTYKINLKKCDQDDRTIPLGASFELYYYDETNKTWNKRTNGISGDGLFSTNPSTGSITISNQLCGSDPTPIIENKTWYKLVEVKAPAGYLINDKPIYYYVSSTGATPTKFPEGVSKTDYMTVSVGSDKPYPLTVTNSKLKLDIKKIAGDNDIMVLTGAEFKIYSDEACTSEIQTAAEVKTGIYRFSGIAIESNGTGTFYIKETKAPDDYEIDDKVYKVTVEDYLLKSIVSVDGTVTLAKDNKDGSYLFSNESNSGSLIIKKTIDASSSERNKYKNDVFNFVAEITDENGDPYTDSAGGDRAFPAIKTLQDGTTETGVYYSEDVISLKDKETISISGIPSGAKYKVKELGDARFSAGYELEDKANNKKYTWTISDNCSGIIDQNSYDSVTFINTPRGSFTLDKKMVNGSNPNSVLEIPEGFTFTITDYSNENKVYVKAEWDSDAKKFKAVELMDGITFDDSVENGFTINQVPHGNIRIFESGEDIPGYACTRSTTSSSDTVTSTYISPYYGPANGKSRSTTVVNTYTASCDAPLLIRKKLTGHSLKSEDFTFELYDTKGTPDDKSDDKLIEVEKNDSVGRAEFSKLKFDTTGEYDYYIVERIPNRASKLADGSYMYQGTIYDKSPIDVHVSVDDSTGKMIANVTYSKDGAAVSDDDVCFENTYTAEGRLELVGKKTLYGRTQKNNDFTFLADITKTDSDGTTTVATGVEIGKSRSDGTIKFSGVHRNDAGEIEGDYLKFSAEDIGSTFTYDIYEKIPAETDNEYINGMQYSTKHYKVIAEVSDNRDGTLKVRRNFVDPDDASAAPASLDFVNTYTVESEFRLKADKMLTGRSLAANQFEFEVIDTDDGNKVVATGKNNAAGEILFTPIEYYIRVDASGETSNLGAHHYAVREVTPESDKDGYTYDRDTYNLTVTAADSSQGTVRYIVTGASYDSSDGTYKLRAASGKRACFVNKYVATGTLPINIKKTLRGRDMVIDDEYEFYYAYTVIDENGQETGDGNYYPYGYTLKDGSVQTLFPFTFDQNYAGKKLAFYFIEATPDNGRAPTQTMPSVEYSDQVYRLELTITDNGDGTLKIDQSLTDKDGKAANEMEFINTYKAEGSITFEADKLLKGRDIEDQQFTFDILENGNVVATGTNDAAGKIEFSEIKFYIDGDDSYVGEHNYVVKERIPNPVPAGYTYDNTEHQVKVTATDKTNGTLDIVVTGASLSTDGIKYTITKPDTAEATFVNGYEAKGVLQLEGTKTLHGRALKDGEFEFSAVEYKLDSNGNAVETGRTFSGTNDANGKITFEDIEYKRNASTDDRGLYRYKIKEVVPAQKLGGVIYDTAEYLVMAAVNDNGDGTMSVNTNLIDAAGVMASEIAFSNDYQAEEILSIEADKTLKGRVIEDKQFSFEIYEGDVLVATGTNDDSGKVVFTDLRFYIDGDDNNMGDHSYTVKEVIPAVVPDGYTYDTTEFELNVTATDNEDGTIKLDVSGEGEKASFTNTYEADGKLTIEAEKVLAGRNLYSDEFSFKAEEYKLENGNPVATGKVLTAKNTDTGKVTFETVTYTKNDTDGDNTGDYIYKVSEDVPAKALPGVTYDESVFTVKVNVADSGNGTLTVTSEILDKDDEAVEDIKFENSYKSEAIFSLKADKAVTGAVLTDGQFTFDMYEGDKLIASGTNDADGNIIFDDVRFFIDGNDSYAGKHEYTVKERIPETKLGGYTYDEETYEITVDAIDNEQGGIDLIVTGAEADKSGKNAGYILTKIKGKAAAFVNIYEAVAEVVFEGTKTVENLDKDCQKRALNAGDFKFTLEEYKEADKEFVGIGEALNTTDGSFAFEKISYELGDIGTHYYVITEVKGDKNYVHYSAEPVYAVVTVSDAGDGTLSTDVKYYKAGSIDELIAGNGTSVTEVAFNNKMTETEVRKTDPAGNQLKGAEISILDSNGKTVYSFVSGEDSTRVYGLERGHTYTLRETKAPEGFKVAADVIFKLDNEGKLFVAKDNNWVEANEITMIDDKVVVSSTNTSVSTGDATALWILFSLLGISLLGIAAVVKKRKK